MVSRYLRQLRDAIRDIQANGNSAPNQNGWLGQLTIAADILASSIRYGASPNNYVAFGWCNSPRIHRRTFLTHRDNARLMRRYNSPRAHQLFTDKLRFNETFQDFLGRRFLDLDSFALDEALAFLQPGSAYLVKARTEGQGRGIKILEYGQAKGLLIEPSGEARTRPRASILEERLEQHPKLSDAFGPGVAPIRVVTIVRDGTVSIILAGIYLGGSHGGQIVNIHQGGVLVPTDLNSGTLAGVGVDKRGVPHETHPETGHPFEGFTVPMWPDVLSFAKQLAEVVPEAGFVGWDIAVTKHGPVVIEGNTDPGTYVGLQRPCFSAIAGGLRAHFEPFLSS